MNTPNDLNQLSPDQLRQLAASLLLQIEQVSRENLQQKQEVHYLKTLNEKLTHEMALLKRHRFGQRSEHLSQLQISLLDDALDADVAAIETELDELQQPVAEQAPARVRKPVRQPLPPELPRTNIHHEPDQDPLWLRLPDETHR